MPGAIEWDANTFTLAQPGARRDAPSPLLDALRGLVAHYADSLPVELRFQAPEELAVSRAMTTASYVTCREALDNASRHAKARRVTLEVIASDDRLVVRVADDGEGFELPGREGRGIARMRAHARLAGGRLEMRSAPHAGTCISLVFTKSS